MTDAPVFTLHEPAPAAERARVDQGLDDFNQAEPALRDVRPLDVMARDAAGAVLGGAVGRTWGACCELQQLWVDDLQRHRGLGRQLMQRFEQAAAQRGCRQVYLDTFPFQAPGFYRKLGYRVVLQTRGYSAGIVRYSLHKVLAG